jgi:F-type H+-transporting ATPase subunit O
MLRAAGALLCRGRQAATALERSLPAARYFAAEAVQDDKKFAPPIHIFGTAGRYASALYTAAAKAGKLDQVEQDFAQLAQITEESEQLHNLLFDPSIPKREKEAGLQAVLDKAQAAQLTRNFFRVLTENNRLRLLDKIYGTFEEILSAARGEVNAKITTAEVLEEGEVQEIRDALQAMVKPGQKLFITEMVDPKIIGGAVVEVGDRFIDLSVLSRVKKVQQMILESV